MPTERLEPSEEYPRHYATAVRLSHDANADAIAGLIRGLTPYDKEPADALTARRAALADALTEASRDDEAGVVADPDWQFTSGDGQTVEALSHQVIDPMAFHHADAALWSSSDDDGPLDDRFGVGDIHPDTWERLHADATKFWHGLPPHLKDAVREDPRMAGRHLWLTRVGHGHGFWAGDWGDHGRELTDHAHALGDVDLHVGDDGMVHGS